MYILYISTGVVVDTSAFVAILKKEDDADFYRRKLLESEKVLISVATTVELHVVVTAKLGAKGVLRLNYLLAQPLFEIIPVSPDQVNSTVIVSFC